MKCGYIQKCSDNGLKKLRLEDPRRRHPFPNLLVTSRGIRLLTCEVEARLCDFQENILI